MSYLRTDRRTQAPNEWGKPGVTYPHGDTAYPQIVEEYTASKGTALPLMLSSHPDTARYPNAKLISIVSDPGDNRSESRHLVYRTLPGPSIWIPGFHSQLGAATSEYRQEVTMPNGATALGSSLVSPLGASQVVYDGDVEPFEDNSLVGIKVTKCISLPPSRTETQSIGFEFPAQFLFRGGWAIPTASGFKLGGPFPGVNFDLTGHTILSAPAQTSISYSFGSSGSVPGIYTVTTPGVADRFFGIGPNTIHNAIHLVETESGGASQVVEDLPASTPGFYTPGATITIRASETLLFGTLHEKRVTTAVCP